MSKLAHKHFVPKLYLGTVLQMVTNTLPLHRKMLTKVHNRVTTLSFSQLWTIILLLIYSKSRTHGIKPSSSQGYSLQLEVKPDRHQDGSEKGVISREVRREQVGLGKQEENRVGLEKAEMGVSFLWSLTAIFSTASKVGAQSPWCG